MPNDIYLGNPLLKKANTPIEFTKEQINEFVKCKKDPIYFAKNYVQIVTLDHGLVAFKPYKFQEKLIKRFHEHRFNICKIGRQSGKCFSINTYIKVRNKNTGEILELTIGEFYEKIKKENDTNLP
jgi:hypothetical protein